MNSTPPTTFTVSQLNRKARQLLEMHLNPVWVEGELTNLATPSSGHWYFSLKDANAQIRCAMFRPLNQKVGFRPKEGSLIRVRAKVSLYEGRGDYQLIVESLEDAGIGALQKAFEALKKKLVEEGLFNPEFKQALPAYPTRIGVITSATGAAIHDILNVLKRRYPVASVTLLPVSVQGKGAAEEIARAIALANRTDAVKLEVLIVGRGGGSLEDLQAFNEEVVARAIFASDIPIVSAVGHETDFSIADFVADLRAPTPSAAAELITPHIGDMARQLAQRCQQSHRRIQEKLREDTQRLQLLYSQLKHPGQSLQEKGQHLDHLEIRLQQSLLAHLQHNTRRYDQLFYRLQKQSPTESFRWLRSRLQQLEQQTSQFIRTRLQQQQQQLQSLSQLLHGVSPLNTLNRGYAIVTDSKNHILQIATDVKAGDRINTRLKSGSLDCTVISIKP